MDRYVFVVEGKAKSYQGRNKDAIKNQQINVREQCYACLGHTPVPLQGALCGSIHYYCFNYKENSVPDADNISKPIWDSLDENNHIGFPEGYKVGFMHDDKQVQVRHVAIVPLKNGAASVMPESDLDVVLEETIFKCMQNGRDFFIIRLAKLAEYHLNFVP